MVTINDIWQFIEEYINLIKTFNVMHILLVLDAVLPALKYGGTERVIWYLGRELVKKNHKVTYLCKRGSSCDFAECVFINYDKSIDEQVPASVDVIHFNDSKHGYMGTKPYIITYHGNYLKDIDRNAVFVSHNHAQRNHSECFVYNGLDWDDYGTFNPNAQRSYFHFLGNAAWRVKNVRGAIDVINSISHQQLYVLGGHRLNFKMGFRLTLSPKIKFKGMVGGKRKIDYLHGSKGLIFPVRWDEPFGLAITESLYCGAPVFGTPYGSLPELVHPEVGFLTNSKDELVNHIANSYNYSSSICHEYAGDLFNSKVMAEGYLQKYELVMNGLQLNPQQPYPMPEESHDRERYIFI